MISLAFLALLIYAGVIYHRARKAARRGNYAATPTAYEPTAYEPASGFAPSSTSLAPSNPFDNRYQASAHSFEMNNQQQSQHVPVNYPVAQPHQQAVELSAAPHGPRYA
jgi:hypothetical protein